MIFVFFFFLSFYTKSTTYYIILLSLSSTCAVCVPCPAPAYYPIGSLALLLSFFNTTTSHTHKLWWRRTRLFSVTKRCGGKTKNKGGSDSDIKKTIAQPCEQHTQNKWHHIQKWGGFFLILLTRAAVPSALHFDLLGVAAAVQRLRRRWWKWKYHTHTPKCNKG